MPVVRLGPLVGTDWRCLNSEFGLCSRQDAKSAKSEKQPDDVVRRTRRTLVVLGALCGFARVPLSFALSRPALRSPLRRAKKSFRGSLLTSSRGGARIHRSRTHMGDCTVPLKLTVTSHSEQAQEDRRYWRSQSPEARLDEVERLRLEAGKFLYEYPARLRRVLAVTGRSRR